MTLHKPQYSVSDVKPCSLETTDDELPVSVSADDKLSVFQDGNRLTFLL